MDFSEIVKTGVKVAGVLGTVGAAVGGAREVAKLGEAAGIKPVGLLKSAGNFAADVVGLPDQARFGAPTVAGVGTPAETAPRMLGAAPAAAAPVAAPSLLVVCPECQGFGTRIEGTEGRTVALVQCDQHRTASLAGADAVTGMYVGWAETCELGATLEDTCPKPSKNEFVLPGGFQAGAYQSAIIQWQNCVAKYKAAQDAAAKADAKAKADQAAAIDAAKKAQKSHDMKAQEKATKFLLSNQQKAYEKQIADLNAAQAQKATAENQAAIDTLTAQKALAEKSLADMQSTQRDSALQAKLDALQAQVVSAGTKPGGVDELMKMMLMQQMMAQPAAQQMAPQQAMMAAQQQPMMAVPWDQQSMLMQQQPTDQAYFAEQSMTPVYQDPGYAYEFMGTDTAKSDAERFNDATPLDPETADALNISGVSTVGDANMLVGLRIAGWDIGELLGDWDGESQPASSCSVGSCGIQR